MHWAFFIQCFRRNLSFWTLIASRSAPDMADDCWRSLSIRGFRCRPQCDGRWPSRDGCVDYITQRDVVKLVEDDSGGTEFDSGK